MTFPLSLLLLLPVAAPPVEGGAIAAGCQIRFSDTSVQTASSGTIHQTAGTSLTDGTGDFVTLVDWEPAKEPAKFQPLTESQKIPESTEVAKQLNPQAELTLPEPAPPVKAAEVAQVSHQPEYTVPDPVCSTPPATTCTETCQTACEGSCECEECEESSPCGRCCRCCNKSHWIGPGDMPLHLPYYPADHGYYYFRPYNWVSINEHQKIVVQWQGNPGWPYVTDSLARFYASSPLDPPTPEELHVPRVPVTLKPADSLPDLEDILRKAQYDPEGS